MEKITCRIKIRARGRWTAARAAEAEADPGPAHALPGPGPGRARASPGRAREGCRAGPAHLTPLGMLMEISIISTLTLHCCLVRVISTLSHAVFGTSQMRLAMS